MRINSLDLARGFTVFFIAPIHTVLCYSNDEIYHTILGYSLTFIAEGPGAQLFMTLMGIYIAFKPAMDFNTVLRRAGLLFLVGLFLNFVKFVLPILFGWMPALMQTDLQVERDVSGLLHLFLLGDILHFASIALIITHWVRRRPNFANSAFILGTVLMIISPFFWDAHSNNSIIDYFLQLIGGHPPQVFFPLLPWIFYPLLGLLIGDALQRNREAAFSQMFKWGIGWLSFGIGSHYIAGPRYDTSFYRTWPWDTIGHAGIVLLVLCFWEWMDKYCFPNRTFEGLTYCSKKITQIYIIQWVLIIWLIPVFGYRELDYWHTIIAIIITSAGTLLISLTLDKLHNK